MQISATCCIKVRISHFQAWSGNLPKMSNFQFNILDIQNSNNYTVYVLIQILLIEYLNILFIRKKCQSNFPRIMSKVFKENGQIAAVNHLQHTPTQNVTKQF